MKNKKISVADFIKELIDSPVGNSSYFQMSHNLMSFEKNMIQLKQEDVTFVSWLKMFIAWMGWEWDTEEDYARYCGDDEE